MDDRAGAGNYRCVEKAGLTPSEVEELKSRPMQDHIDLYRERVFESMFEPTCEERTEKDVEQLIDYLETAFGARFTDQILDTTKLRLVEGPPPEERVPYFPGEEQSGLTSRGIAAAPGRRALRSGCASAICMRRIA